MGRLCGICQLAMTGDPPQCLHCDQAICTPTGCPICFAQIARAQVDAVAAMNARPHPSASEMLR